MFQAPKRVSSSLRDIAMQYPEVTQWLREWREYELERLEVGGQELIRGRSQLLRELLSHFQLPTGNTTR